jgi:ribulose-phosphate 3-epimerase
MGVPIVQSLRPVTELQIETHLMITDPDNFLDEFDEAGSDLLLVHWEATPNVHRTMHYIRALGNRAGVAINPATPASVLEEILPDISQALVMAVEAGLRTSAVSPHNPAESQRLVPHDRRLNPDCDLAVDRGIDSATARTAVVAGANVLVAGTSLFGIREGVAAGTKKSESKPRFG